MSTVDGRWLRCFRPVPAASIRLVCFPHAGGAASSFRRWASLLDPSIQMHVVQYPGREERLDDPMVDSMDVLVENVCDELDDLPDPVAYFGHSMGGAVAHEVGLRLRASGRTEPVHLFVSGRQPPEHHRNGDLHTRGEQAMADELVRLSPDNAAMLADPDLAGLVLPVVLNDYRLIETYQPSPPERLDCPITVMIGFEDAELTTAEARAWARHTTGRTQVRRLPGDHFYLVEQRAAVVDVINRALGRALERMSPDIRDGHGA